MRAAGWENKKKRRAISLFAQTLGHADHGCVPSSAMNLNSREAARVNTLARTVNAGTTITTYLVGQGLLPSGGNAARSASNRWAPILWDGEIKKLENKMFNLKKALLATALLSMGACSSVAIIDIATDKVKVESMNADPKEVMAEAEHGCAIYNRVPVALSKRALPTNGYIPRYEHLFACMDPTQANAIPRIAAK